MSKKEVAEKHFIWIEDTIGLSKGPHYVCDIEAAGGKSVRHTMEQLLNMKMSESMKNRIRSAKVGTNIKYIKISSRGYLRMLCVSEEDFIKAQAIEELEFDLNDLYDIVHMIKSEMGSITQTILSKYNIPYP